MRTKHERELQEMDHLLVDLGYETGSLLARFSTAMSELSSHRARMTGDACEPEPTHLGPNDTQPMVAPIADPNGLPLPDDLVVGGQVDLSRPHPNPASGNGNGARVYDPLPGFSPDDEGMFPGLTALFRRHPRP